MRPTWLLVPAALAAGACCTIIHGVHQDFAIGSQPTNAEVTVDGKILGHTPVTASLTRKDNHTIRIALAGYQPYEMNITHHVSGWVFGNIIFGGLIGLAVDAITGGLYALDSDQVMAQLAQAHSSAMIRRNGVYVILVAAPDPNWELIASLQPLAQ
jgi:hypothetical protein